MKTIYSSTTMISAPMLFKRTCIENTLFRYIFVSPSISMKDISVITDGIFLS